MDTSTLLILVLFPYFVNAAAGPSGGCDPEAEDGTDLSCDKSLFLVCQTVGEDYACLCMEQYHPEPPELNVNGSCMAPVGLTCNSNAPSPCYNELSKCEGDPPMCRCISSHLQYNSKCLALLGASCLTSDGCIDEHAVCVEMPTTSTSTSSTVAPTALISRNLHQNSRGLSHIHHENLLHKSSTGNVCVCDDGYEAVSMRCQLSGAERSMAIPTLFLVACAITNYFNFYIQI